MATETDFQLLWDFGKLPFDLRIVRINGRMQVGEIGIAKPDQQFPQPTPLVDGHVKVALKTEALLVLFLRNTSSKKIRFAVAPHSTTPGESALGFAFTCLCNGHIYEVGPGETWYRVMKLAYRNSQPAASIVLKHVIFEVTNDNKPKGPR